MSEIRLNKYLAEQGYCSRREADRLIESGRVFVNGKRAQLGDKISDRATVRVDGRAKAIRREFLYIVLNKPMGVSMSVKARTSSIYDYLETDQRIYPLNSVATHHEGLVLLTDDPVLSGRFAKSSFHPECEFVVEVDRTLDRKDLKAMQTGVETNRGITAKAKVRQIDTHRFAIILFEETISQIEPMCETLGYHVVLVRQTRIATMKLPLSYPTGNARFLTESEIGELKKAVGLRG